MVIMNEVYKINKKREGWQEVNISLTTEFIKMINI